MAHSESPAEQGRSKGSNRGSWLFWPKIIPYEKANAIAHCLENRFTHHDLCDERHERRVETIVQDVLETEDTAPSEKIRLCDLKKLMNSLKLKKALFKATFDSFNTSLQPLSQAVILSKLLEGSKNNKPAKAR
jgi:hypothetical protein